MVNSYHSIIPSARGSCLSGDLQTLSVVSQLLLREIKVSSGYYSVAFCSELVDVPHQCFKLLNRVTGIQVASYYYGLAHFTKYMVRSPAVRLMGFDLQRALVYYSYTFIVRWRTK